MLHQLLEPSIKTRKKSKISESFYVVPPDPDILDISVVLLPVLLLPAGCQGQLLLDFLQLHLDVVHVHRDLAGWAGPGLLD